MVYKIQELKEDTVEGLIAKLVYNAVSMAHTGHATKVQVEAEKRIVKELGNRIDIDVDVLLKKINY